MPLRLFLTSGDLMADRRFEFARGEIRQQLGERDKAIAAFRQARDCDPEDQHGPGLHLMRLGDTEIAEMPKAYVQALFDQYAPRFEHALINDLGYRAPALIFKAVLAARAAAAKPAFFKRAIDLGCGTGLAA